MIFDNSSTTRTPVGIAPTSDDLASGALLATAVAGGAVLGGMATTTIAGLSLVALSAGTLASMNNPR